MLAESKYFLFGTSEKFLYLFKLLYFVYLCLQERIPYVDFELNTEKHFSFSKSLFDVVLE